MRVIAGKFKGKVLKEFELSSTRPTTDLVKGAVFNILGSRIVDARFLDLFSGTGAMGIEAISRGANQVVLADNNKESVSLIKKNLALIKADNFIIMQNDCFETLKILYSQNKKFDIIFIDPPYNSTYAEKCIKLIHKLDLLSENGLIVWEHDQSKLELVQKCEQIRTKKYGKKYISILEKEVLTVFVNNYAQK